MKQLAHIPAALTLFVASLLPIQSHADSIPESRWKQWMPKVSGTIRAKGTPEEVLSSQAFRDIFHMKGGAL